MSLLAWWTKRSDRRRAEAEARHLVKEARRILKKRSYRIPESVSSVVEARIGEVDAAVEERNGDRLRRAITELDEAMDKHLAFARKSTLREYAESIGFAVAVALLLRAFVVEAFQIPSGSMIPTLEVGDHIFVSKSAYGITVPFTNIRVASWGTPKRGDIIVFKFPGNQAQDYIKRVVGLPGDTVEVRRNEVFVNGRPMPREYVNEPCRYMDIQSESNLRTPRDCELWMEDLDGRRHATYTERGSGGRDYARTTIPQGSVFVMGDNRDNSADSRMWGFVSEELIKGRALVIWWSREPTDGVPWFLSPEGWHSIRWRRFFTGVK